MAQGTAWSYSSFFRFFFFCPCSPVPFACPATPLVSPFSTAPPAASRWMAANTYSLAAAPGVAAVPFPAADSLGSAAATIDAAAAAAASFCFSNQSNQPGGCGMPARSSRVAAVRCRVAISSSAVEPSSMSSSCRVGGWVENCQPCWQTKDSSPPLAISQVNSRHDSRMSCCDAPHHREAVVCWPPHLPGSILNTARAEP